MAPRGAHPPHVQTEPVVHRGPDGAGERAVGLPWASVSLGVRRLAIVGAREVPVPFHEDGITIAFNGEIYNWRALRSELPGPWRTECDVEVVARAWRRWGVRCLDRFEGMFAMVLVDETTGQVLVARDRAGEKPLYYARANDAWHFASEVKALGVELVEDVCDELDALEYDCTDATPFRGVLALPPGHFMLLDGSEPTISKWWSLPEPEPCSPDDVPALLDELTELVRTAVVERARADVPVAVLASGGLDSAIIQAVARKERLYTVDFNGETGMRGTNLVSFGRADALEVLPRLAYHLDTPATWTSVALWFLAAAISRSECKVVLSGEGADEIFGGYSRYKMLAHIDALRRDAWLEDYRPLGEYIVGTDDDVLVRLLDRSCGAHRATIEALVDAYAFGPTLVRRAMALDWHTTMQVLLRMIDRTMMAHGLEGRCPFLSHHVIRAAARLPDEWLASGAGTKVALREIAHRLGVPKQIVESKRKHGLPIPWNAWFPEAARAGRGGFDRSHFAQVMRSAWRSAFWPARAQAGHPTRSVRVAQARVRRSRPQAM